MKDAVWSCATQTLAALSVAVFALKSSWISYRETVSNSLFNVDFAAVITQVKKKNTCSPSTHQLHVTLQ